MGNTISNSDTNIDNTNNENENDDEMSSNRPSQPPSNPDELDPQNNTQINKQNQQVNASEYGSGGSGTVEEEMILDQTDTGINHSTDAVEPTSSSSTTSSNIPQLNNNTATQLNSIHVHFVNSQQSPLGFVNGDNISRTVSLENNNISSTPPLQLSNQKQSLINNDDTTSSQQQHSSNRQGVFRNPLRALEMVSNHRRQLSQLLNTNARRRTLSAARSLNSQSIDISNTCENTGATLPPIFLIPSSSGESFSITVFPF